MSECQKGTIYCSTYLPPIELYEDYLGIVPSLTLNGSPIAAQVQHWNEGPTFVCCLDSLQHAPSADGYLSMSSI